jgi:hypothetical protein
MPAAKVDEYLRSIEESKRTTLDGVGCVKSIPSGAPREQCLFPYLSAANQSRSVIQADA